MSFQLKPGQKIFVYNEAIDMRGGFGKLQALVVEKMKGNLFDGHLFLFFGKNRKRAKMLRFDGTGVLLIAKRLDRAVFMSVDDLNGTTEVTEEEFARLLDGANLRVLYASVKRKRDGEEAA